MPSLTSVNIACGGHAGDEQTMKSNYRAGASLEAGAGCASRLSRSRKFRPAGTANAGRSYCGFRLRTSSRISRVAAQYGVSLAHVKPHGALYNQAVGNRVIAEAIAKGVARWRRDVVLIGLAGSQMLEVFREAGFAVAAEAFADRRYEVDGTLRSRKFDDALIRDPEEAGRQALNIVQRGTVIACDGSEVPINAQTLCVHGDTPGAPEIAAAVSRTLRGAGISLSALGRSMNLPFVVVPATARKSVCPTKRSAVPARCTGACSVAVEPR